MTIHILSVDDEKDLELIFNQFFAHKIRSGKYIFHYANDGIEALKVLSAHPEIDVVLSDINMPQMDGLTLLSLINKQQNPILKCVMVSAYGDMENIRTAMNNGAFDFVTKPINLRDLERTIEKAAAQSCYIRELQQSRKQLNNIKNELSAAGKIQRALLSHDFSVFRHLPVEIYAQMTPAYEVGGDFYDFFQIDDRRIGFVIADVSGKGIPASLLMAVSRTMIRTVGLSKNMSSESVVTHVNKLLCKESVDSMFVTLFYGIYDTATGDLDYTNASHLPPYVLHADGTVEVLPRTENFIVGVTGTFVFKGNHYRLPPGDKLFTFTDGITEAFNQSCEAFGELRLIKSLQKHCTLPTKECVENISESVQAFTGKQLQSDDITILAIQNTRHR